MGRASKHSSFFKAEERQGDMNADNQIFVAILHQAVRDAFVKIGRAHV